MSDTLEFMLKRDILRSEFTLGRLLVNETQHLGYICEDTDRELENYPERKIQGETAIPRGRYRLTATHSNRFKRVMPLIVDVPGFSGIRVHGGNDEHDTEGCPLLGKTRTVGGVCSCEKVNALLLKMILDAEESGVLCWITVR